MSFQPSQHHWWVLEKNPSRQDPGKDKMKGQVAVLSGHRFPSGDWIGSPQPTSTVRVCCPALLLNLECVCLTELDRIGSRDILRFWNCNSPLLGLGIVLLLNALAFSPPWTLHSSALSCDSAASRPESWLRKLSQVFWG